MRECMIVRSNYRHSEFTPSLLYRLLADEFTLPLTGITIVGGTLRQRMKDDWVVQRGR